MINSIHTPKALSVGLPVALGESESIIQHPVNTVSAEPWKTSGKDLDNYKKNAEGILVPAHLFDENKPETFMTASRGFEANIIELKEAVPMMALLQARAFREERSESTFGFDKTDAESLSKSIIEEMNQDCHAFVSIHAGMLARTIRE